MKLKSFKTYIAESETSDAADMEQVIVQVWNGEPVPKKMIKLKATAIKIVEQLKKDKVSGDGEHMGRGEYPLTPDWKKYGAKNKTPKTDLRIGKYKLSLKKEKAQLMSGGKAESTATFMNSLSAINRRLKKQEKDLISSLEKDFDSFVERGLTKDGTVADALKSKKDRALLAGDKAHKKMMEHLGQLFDTSEDFRDEFVYEAMTGDIKFGKTAPASANYMLAFNNDGSTVALHKAKTKSYIRKVSNKVTISVRFKSVSQKLKKQKTGKYSYWSVVGLAFDSLKEEVQKEYSDGQYITEGIIGNIIDKIKNFFKKIFNALKDVITKGAESIMTFFGFEPEINVIDSESFTTFA